MASVFEKIRVLTLGNLHDILDAAIDLNSVGACKQYVRDLEEAKDKMQQTAATARGRLSIAEGDLATLTQRIATDNEHAELLLTDDDASNDGHAQTLIEGVIRMEEELIGKKAAVETAKATSAALAVAVDKIVTKHVAMVSNIRKLEAIAQQTAAQNEATKALKQASKLVGTADGVSVDNVERRLREQAATSNEQFKTALGGLDTGSGAAGVGDSITAAKAKQRIAALKAKKNGTTATSGT
jgi:phage shock protein A